MNYQRTYSPLYKEYIKDYSESLNIEFLKDSYKKAKNPKPFNLANPSPRKKYLIRFLALNNEEVFSSGTLEREKEKNVKKCLKIEDIPADVPVSKEFKRLKSIENLPETIEIPKKSPKKQEKPEKLIPEKPPAPPPPPRVKTPDPPRPPPKKSKPFKMPKQNPVFKPREKAKIPELRANLIVNDELSEKTSEESSVNSIDFSIVIDYDNLQDQYNSKFVLKSGSSQNTQKFVLAKNMNRENLNLSIIGKKFDINQTSFIKQRSFKVAKSQQYFLPPKRVQVKKNLKWMSLKPATVNFSEGIRRYGDEPHRYAVVENKYARIRKVNRNKSIKSLLQRY